MLYTRLWVLRDREGTAVWDRPSLHRFYRFKPFRVSHRPYWELYGASRPVTWWGVFRMVSVRRYGDMDIKLEGGCQLNRDSAERRRRRQNSIIGNSKPSNDVQCKCALLYLPVHEQDSPSMVFATTWPRSEQVRTFVYAGHAQSASLNSTSFSSLVKPFCYCTRFPLPSTFHHHADAPFRVCCDLFTHR